ncbi:Disease resistance protein RGA2 [Spatholobus suberectus]|nr:Disease resistance protein RGA2 [Spatholobus suberectus]
MERNVMAKLIQGLGNKERAAKYVCEDGKVKNGFDVPMWIDGVQLQEHYAEFVMDQDLGHKFVKDFLRRSIFKVSEDEDGQIRTDIGESLAAVVVGKDNVYVKDDGIDNHVCRVALSSDWDVDVYTGIPRSLSETNKNGLKALESLTIEDISDLESLPEGMQHLDSLDALKIKGCPKLKTVPEEICNILYWTRIVIDDCPKLASLPKSLEGKYAVLTIRNCPSLESWIRIRQPQIAIEIIKT